MSLKEKRNQHIGSSLEVRLVGWAQDIYVTRRASLDSPWGTPQTLGPAINLRLRQSNLLAKRRQPRIASNQFELRTIELPANGDWPDHGGPIQSFKGSIFIPQACEDGGLIEWV